MSTSWWSRAVAGTGDVTALADRTRHHQPSRAQPYLGLPQRHIRLLADAAPQRLPDLVARLMKRRSAALSRRRAAHRAWQTASTLQARGADRSHTRDRSPTMASSSEHSDPASMTSQERPRLARDSTELSWGRAK